MTSYCLAVMSCFQILVSYVLIFVTILVTDKFTNFHIFQRKHDMYKNNFGEQSKETRGEYFNNLQISITNLTKLASDRMTLEVSKNIFLMNVNFR